MLRKSQHNFLQHYVKKIEDQTKKNDFLIKTRGGFY